MPSLHATRVKLDKIKIICSDFYKIKCCAYPSHAPVFESMGHESTMLNLSYSLIIFSVGGAQV